MTNGIFYYKTDVNARIRSIDLKKIDFSKAQSRVMPLETVTEQPIEAVDIR